MINNILITGCTRGLGNSLAKHFANSKKNVFAVGRDLVLLEELSKFSERINPIHADISTKEGRETIVETLLRHQANISIIHNAAIAEPSMLSSLSEELFQQHIDTNYVAPFFITQKLLPKLVGQRVLHISSGASMMPLSGLMPYCTTKAAVEHMTNCLNKELNEQHIYFANLRPGMIDTPMESKFRDTSPDILPLRDFYRRVYSENKLLSPELVAEFVAWVMLETQVSEFSSTLWNIYDEKYHTQWLTDPARKPMPPSL